jgi:hypothetical protein
MKMKKLVALILVAVISFPCTSKVAVYDGKPLTVDLPINRDVVIRFDEPQRVGASPSLTAKVSFKPSGNFVSLTALDDFGLDDVIFQGLNTGKVVYVRVRSLPEDSSFEDEIIIRSALDVAEKSETGKQSKTLNLTPREVLESFSRSIAQEFGVKYAIESALFSIRELPNTHLMQPVVGLYKKPYVDISPIKTFSGHGLLGTVFLLENKSTERLEINPAEIRGDWIALDMVSSDAVLRPNGKTLITLFHLRPLPRNINDVVLNGVLK